VTGDETIGVLTDLCCRVGSGRPPDIDRIDVPKAP
jgi:hypothetical protein